MHRYYYTNLGVLIVAMIVASSSLSALSIKPIQEQVANAVVSDSDVVGVRNAPIATSGDNNVYVSWWSNKSGNNEVMFKASSDGGKTLAIR
jgi:hypothetical protein